MLGIYDTDTDQLLELVEETRCPVPGNLVDRDEVGNIYFSNWIWPAAGTLMRGAPEPCVLRITPDSERFDPTWTFDYGSLAQDRQGAMFTYLRDQKALVSIFLNEMTSFDATTNPWEYAGGNFWQIRNGTCRLAPVRRFRESASTQARSRPCSSRAATTSWSRTPTGPAPRSSKSLATPRRPCSTSRAGAPIQASALSVQGACSSTTDRLEIEAHRFGVLCSK